MALAIGKALETADETILKELTYEMTLVGMFQ